MPAELTKGPFSLDEAGKAGLTLGALKGRAWRRLGFELYCRAGLPVDHWAMLSAWRRVLPPEAVFAGATAAYLHGFDLEPTPPVEIQVPATLACAAGGSRPEVVTAQVRETLATPGVAERERFELSMGQ